VASGADASTLDGSNGFTIVGEGGAFGDALACISDMNCDGVLDIAIGAPRVAKSGFSIIGNTYFVFGNRSNTDATMTVRNLTDTMVSRL
jgi:hypothetical protein